MPRQLLSSDRLTGAVPYHYAAAGTGEALVFSAGACPLDGDARVVATGDIAGQARQALANLTVALEDAGCAAADVVKTTIFVASSSREDLVLAWDEYAKVFVYSPTKPASSRLARAAPRRNSARPQTGC